MKQTYFIILLLFGISNEINAQEVLTKTNGGASWSPKTGSTLVKAKRTSSMNVATSTATDLVYTTEDIDINGDLDHTTGVFTPPHAGYYVIHASIDWDILNTAEGTSYIRLLKNNTTIIEQHSQKNVVPSTIDLNTIIYSDGSDSYKIVVGQVISGNGVLGTGGNIVTPGCVFVAYNLD